MFIGLPMIAGFVPFGLSFTNPNTFYVNITSVYNIGVCNKMVFDLIWYKSPKTSQRSQKPRQGVQLIHRCYTKSSPQ